MWREASTVLGLRPACDVVAARHMREAGLSFTQTKRKQHLDPRRSPDSRAWAIAEEELTVKPRATRLKHTFQTVGLRFKVHPAA
jgi:hypothetical protein